jgi:lipoprotein-anchoring transpeptidase ErfK/SrfK
MKFSKVLIVLFLFILSLPLFCEDYLIRVDFSERKLFLVGDSGLIIATYPVAVPGFVPNYLPAYGIVTGIEKNPHWYPTERTRKHYLEAYGIELPKIVNPDDPLNAMGIAQIVIRFDDTMDVNPLIRIHGTNDEDSVGKRVTSGCIRLHNKDILELIGLIEGRQIRVIFDK